MTKSLLVIMSKTSPRVPSTVLKPQASASSQEGEPSLSAIETLMPFTPASSRESLMFCAWAGACGHPNTLADSAFLLDLKFKYFKFNMITVK